MALLTSMAAAIAKLNARVDLIDAASGSPNNGRLRIWTGTPPASTASARTGTCLALFTLASTAFGAAADGGGGSAEATINAGSDTTGLATGTAGYYDVTDGAGTVIEQGRCTMTGESPSGEMVLVNTSIAVGQPVSFPTYVASEPTLGAGSA